MKLTLERQIPLAFIVALLLLVTIGFFAYRSVNSLNEAIKWEKHTQEVLLQLDKVQNLALEAETGTRGFLITGNESFLEPYNNSKQKIDENLNHLRELTADNPSQKQRLERIEELNDQKLSLLQKYIDLRRTNSLDSLLSQAKVGQGKALTDNIRNMITEMEDEERNLLKNREADLDNSLKGMYRMFFLVGFAGILSLGLANLAIFRETGKRRVAENNLKETNAGLEKRVENRTKELAQINENLKSEIKTRQQYEEVLRESEIFTRAILDSLSAHIAVIDKDGKIIAVNEAWEGFAKENSIAESEQLLGVGQNYLDICKKAVSSEEAVKEVLENLEAVLKGEMAQFYYEYPCHSPDEKKWFFLQATTLNEAREGGAVISHFDITDRKQGEEEREKLLQSEQSARKDAEIANRLRDEFLATVSHELRAPLNSILGWSRLMQQGKLEEKTFEKAIETIVRNSEAQNRLIEDLLDVSRIISGKLRLEVITLNPTNVVEAAMETVRPAADAKNITLEIKADKEVSHISGDPNRLQQVVWNLLSNAIKFTPNDGKVGISIMRTDSHVEIQVKDSGVGIKEEFLPHVFDRFRQADASSIRKFGGLGLGLAIVRHITEMHGGTVQAESDGENKGTTFTVKLPLIISKSEENGSDSKRSSNLLDANTNLSLDGLLVLVVDDEEDTRQLLVQSLTFHGATVITAASAQQGLTEFKDKNPDVLISDIGMPDEDGYSLIRKIRNLNNEIPAVALTAFTRAQDRVRSLSAGFQTHVAKPVEPDELVTVIASLTKRLQMNDTNGNDLKNN